MELFTIQCTTCKARLIVKDESVIGDILACPKCQSMVQVVPPVGWKRQVGDSLSGELAGIGPAASQATPQESKPAAKKPPAKKAAAAIPPALPRRAAPAESSAATGAQAAPVSSSATAPTTEAVPAPSWLSAVTVRMKRDWLLLGGGLLGGIVLGVAVWLVVAAGSPAPETAADSTSVDQSPVDPSSPEPAAGQAEAPAPDRSPAPTVKTPPPIEPAPPETTRLAQASNPPVPTREDTADAAAEPPAEDDTANEAAPDAAGKESGPALKLEPVRSAGIVVGAETNGNGSLLTTTAPSAAEAPAVDQPQEPDDEVADAPPPDERASLSRDQIDERLQTALAEVEFADVQLAGFAAFITDVTGVTVVLDEAALGAAGRRTPISVKLAKTTAGEALRAAVQRVGLTYVVDDGRIVITKR